MLLLARGGFLREKRYVKVNSEQSTINPPFVVKITGDCCHGIYKLLLSGYLRVAFDKY